jgi:hypothetical protein
MLLPKGFCLIRAVLCCAVAPRTLGTAGRPSSGMMARDSGQIGSCTNCSSSKSPQVGPCIAEAGLALLVTRGFPIAAMQEDESFLDMAGLGHNAGFALALNVPA